MTRDEFAREIRKVKQRLGVVQKLLAARSGLTNRQRKSLDKEQRLLSDWLEDMPWVALVDTVSWGSEDEMRFAEVCDLMLPYKGHTKRLR
jgi:hypothetical protein